MTYHLLTPNCSSGLKAIRCLLCGTVSDKPADVTQRYCKKCDRFHDSQLELAQTALMTAIQLARPDLDEPARHALLGEMLQLLSPANTPIQSALKWSDPSFPEGGSMQSPAPDKPQHGVREVLWNNLANGWWLTCLCGYETRASRLLEDVGREFDEHLAQATGGANAAG